MRPRVMAGRTNRGTFVATLPQQNGAAIDTPDRLPRLVGSGVCPAGVTRPSSKLYENFGFDFAEDQAENTPQIILGEANYKTWVNSVDPDNFLNQQVRHRML